MSWKAIRGLIRFVLLGGMLAGLLAACIQTDPEGICPRVAILEQASEVTEFAEGRARTPENVVYTAEITDIVITCRYQDALFYVMDADVNLTMNVERGPALQGDSVTLQYFVAVTDRRGNVLGKRVFDLDVDFEGQDSVQVVQETWQGYRFDRAGSGLSYETWTGFQLTDEQLEYVREQRRRANNESRGS